MVTKAKKRRVNRDLDADQKKARARLAYEELSQQEIYPLNAPGMPPPGPSFLEQARRLGDKSEVTKKKIVLSDGTTKTVNDLTTGEILSDLHRKALRESGFNLPIDIKPGVRKPVTFVPGHIWGENADAYLVGDPAPVSGPAPADVMVIGKMPADKDVEYLRSMQGVSAEMFMGKLRDMKFENTSKWYVTNLLKFRPPDGSTTIKSSWMKDCTHLLHHELRLVRPKYILCLGADPSKAVLGKKYNVSYMDGRVMPLTFPINLEFEEDEDAMVDHTSLVMTIPNPAAVLRSPDISRQFDRGLGRFKQLIAGKRFDREETDIDHRWITNLQELKDLLYEIRNDPEKKDNLMAVDAEWHGEHPMNAGAYVRTIQLAWRVKHGAALILNDTDGNCCFFDEEGKPAIQRAMKLLNKFIRGYRVGGHFFVADLEWLDHLGLDEFKKSFATPLYDAKVGELREDVRNAWRSLGYSDEDELPAWMRTKFEGGWDTGLRAHALEETAMLGLEGLVTRYTDVPRYDVPLHDWKISYCREHGMKSKDLEGYGPCPDDILVPYGIYDADATLRLFYAQEPYIESDYEGNCCREPAWEGQITALPILEMHQTGLGVNKKRIDQLTKSFMKGRLKVEKKIQDWAKWPDFNIRSVMQVREFLFGEKYNGKKTKDGGIIRIRPDGAKTLSITPLVDTSKPPKPWRQIIDDDKEGEHNPSTAKTVLGILAQEAPDNVTEQVQWIRDYRFLDQVLKSLLRPPVTDKATGELASNDDADTDWAQGLIYDAGLAHVICDDGRVRTHLYPTTETGRWRSARPNLQNISKRRDPDYKRLLGDEYKHKLRSILVPAPGTVIVEADYIGAELYGMAIMSGDRHMIEHAQRNQLPDSGFDENGNPDPAGKFPHPDFYDMHSNVAKLAFGLDCQPTKAGLAAANMLHMRIVAKTVIFGIAYGRGSKAIAFEARMEGITISKDEAQAVIDTILDMYPGLRRFFADCAQRVHARWMSSCFGRLRRFPEVDDQKMVAEFERQAKNFTIQSMVASLVDRAAAYLMDYRDNVLKQPDLFKMVLQIHDALMFQVPCQHVETMIEKVIPLGMRDMCPVYPTKVDGTPIEDVNAPYYLGLDTEVCQAWGEDVSVDYARKYGLPLKYAKQED